MNFPAVLKARLVAWVWDHTPDCAEMSRLTSRALEQPLTLRTRLKMRLHFVICSWCRRYYEQVNFLHMHALELHSQQGDLPGRGLPIESRRRILERVQFGWQNSL